MEGPRFRSSRGSRPAHRLGWGDPDAPPPTWGERLAALKHIPPLLRLVFQTHRGYTTAILVLRAVRSLIPLAVLWPRGGLYAELFSLRAAGYR